MNLLTHFAAFILLFSVCNAGTPAQVKPDDANIQVIISALNDHPWQGVTLVGESPTQWDFALTEPMSTILKIGKPAQGVLLRNLDSPKILAQVIFLLGGVGDENAVEPIINSMIPEARVPNDPTAKLVNGSANVALTNITVADVIWHHGGGIVIDQCPNRPRECWENWWSKNRTIFRVDKITQSRRYSNYPGYGIYSGVK